jgi:hypothetical protein
MPGGPGGQRVSGRRGRGRQRASAGWPPQNGVVMYIGIGTVILIIILILLLT